MPNFVPMSRLAIAIGNTHIKLGLFADQSLINTWQVRTNQLQQLARLADELAGLPCAIASVNPEVVTPWHHWDHTWLLGLPDIPLPNTYPSLGLDRAVVGWAGGQIYGWPILVIDLGTAISLTGLDQSGNFRGGAILPGVRSQFRSLHQDTAALPLVTQITAEINPWGQDTFSAVCSGVVWGVSAALAQYIQAWQQLAGSGVIVITGGDQSLIYTHLIQILPADQSLIKSDLIKCDPNLILAGINLLSLARDKINKTDC
ncbi:MAG: type III pantothenate kinase [Pseudanabaenaceae cyanobacterium bins.68]|nr:type III pantothenate kinase [Pseudanabaenaceae cyanobacterium bins.68]